MACDYVFFVRLRLSFWDIFSALNRSAWTWEERARRCSADLERFTAYDQARLRRVRLSTRWLPLEAARPHYAILGGQVSRASDRVHEWAAVDSGIRTGAPCRSSARATQPTYPID